MCTTLGFFSIVKKGGAGKWQVRARVRRDLLNLCKATGIPPSAITTKGGGDYAYRIVVDDLHLVKVFDALRKEITYDNFKSEVGRRPDQARHLSIYHKWWGDMLCLQEPTGLDRFRFCDEKNA